MRKLSKLFMKAKMYIVLLPISLNLIGAGLNQAVLVANGGKFPVMLNQSRQLAAADEGGYLDDHHVVMTGETKLNWLADFIDLHLGIFSPGDILIGIGEDTMMSCAVIWITLLLTTLAKTID